MTSHVRPHLARFLAERYIHRRSLAREMPVGLVNDIKASSAAEDAKRAARDSRSVFVYKLAMPILNNAVSSPVSKAAEVIEAIEQAGWMLQQFAMNDRRRGQMVMIFRRM